MVFMMNRIQALSVLVFGGGTVGRFDLLGQSEVYSTLRFKVESLWHHLTCSLLSILLSLLYQCHMLPV